MDKIYKMRLSLILDRCDRILEQYNCPKYSEYAVRKGGDLLCFRVYGKSEEDFMICER